MAAKSWNKVELMGNLTRDPELRYTPSGTAVATFSIATNRSYVSEGERKEEADFHRIVAWGKLAELCNQLLKKGNRVFVSGRLQTRSWEGQDGATRQTTEVVIDDMILLTAKNGPPSTGEDLADVIPTVDVSEKGTPEKKVTKEEPTQPPPAADETVADDDLPF